MSDAVLTIIPAKARSTRLSGKNMAFLRGKPLVVHAIEHALASEVCGEICVGTDDEVIAEVALNAGAKVPFLRTGDSDDVTSVGTAAANIVRRYREELGRTFRYVCLLLATSPLRHPDDIRRCFDVLKADSDLDASMSFVYAEKHPCWAWQFVDEKRIEPMFSGRCHSEREDLPKPYYADGSVYWARADFFEQENGNQYAGRVGGYVVPPERAVDVDTLLDLNFCEYLLNKREKGL